MCNITLYNLAATFPHNNDYFSKPLENYFKLLEILRNNLMWRNTVDKSKLFSTLMLNSYRKYLPILPIIIKIKFTGNWTSVIHWSGYVIGIIWPWTGSKIRCGADRGPQKRPTHGGRGHGWGTKWSPDSIFMKDEDAVGGLSRRKMLLRN